MSEATQTGIEEALTCQCGCGLTVHSCNHLQCPSAIPLKAEIASQLALGKTRPEVLAHFADTYGEKILSAPTATGFNLIAWVMPFLAVLVAGIAIVAFTRRWRPKPAVPPAHAGPSGSEDAEALRRARLRAELERFEG